VGIGNDAPEDKPTWSSNDNDRNKLNVTGHTHITGSLNVTGHLYGDGSNLSGVAAVIAGYWILDESNDNISYSAGNVGIGVVSPGAELHVAGTGAIIVPVGTTGERPGTAANGMFRYNSETGYLEGYTASGWGALATQPSIASISPTSSLLADTATQVFTVSGSFFDSGLAINLVGADGTNYSVVDPTFVNAATATFKMGDLSSATAQLANRPYTVKVTCGSGLVVTSIQTIGFSGISWTSPAAGATLATFVTTTSANNTELAATDDVGGNDVTFSVPAANLPSGLTLNTSTGAITGQIGAATAAGGVSVTFRVTDNVTGATLDRTFSIVGVQPLYPFTTHTFTNAGKTGSEGPTITQLQGSYGTTGSTAWVGATSPAYLAVVTQGIQEWTVPQDGTYEIKIAGAGGAAGGSGAEQVLDLNLTKSTILKICVGQKGTTSYPSQGGGGGGGSFLVDNTTLLCASGGAGGFGGDATFGDPASNGVSVSNGGSGGSGGSGGGTGLDGAGQSGAGFSGDGASTYSDETKPESFLNGCVGGTIFGAAGNSDAGRGGGFGGGGGGYLNNTSGQYYRSGGGGGYSGGGAGGYGGGYAASGGGGGSSYSSTTVISTSTNSGHGYVVITLK
jgi:hypothetical protein